MRDRMGSKPILLIAVVLVLTLTAPALAQDIPDFGSARTLPSPNTNYEITDDGHLIKEGDMVQSCKTLEFPNFAIEQYEDYAPEAQANIRERYKRLYDALAEACTEAGFPPNGKLPRTGGPLADTFPVMDDGTCPEPLVKRNGACHPQRQRHHGKSGRQAH
jgi:hypothetical protein